MQLSNPPASIAKSVKPFISRANELLTVKPAISYFCKLYAARIILNSKLHVDNEEVTTYVSMLLDNIEELKDNANEELKLLLDDDLLALKYVMDFAFEIFDSLNSKVENRCVNRNTALEFIASVNFLQLTSLWEDELSEVQLNDIKQRIKYAKFHAARILKCFKNGQDPNDYEIESPDKQGQVNSEAGHDDETKQKLLRLENDLMKDSSLDNLRSNENINFSSPEKSVNSIGSPEVSKNIPSISNYSNSPDITGKLIHGVFSSSQDSINIANSLDDVNISQTLKTENINESVSNIRPNKTLSTSPPVPAHIVPAHIVPGSHEVASPPITKKSITHDHNYTKQEIKEIMDDAEIISKAQKHAKFAISALNYEDKGTAIKELIKALELLKQ